MEYFHFSNWIIFLFPIRFFFSLFLYLKLSWNIFLFLDLCYFSYIARGHGPESRSCWKWINKKLFGFFFQVVSHLTEKILLFLKLCPMFYLWATKPSLLKRNSKWTMTKKSCWLLCQNFHPVLQWFYLIYNLCNVNHWFLVISANKLMLSALKDIKIFFNILG